MDVGAEPEAESTLNTKRAGNGEKRADGKRVTIESHHLELRRGE